MFGDDAKGQWRPSMDDVIRISWGKPAKHKGVGSRGVPHRLNAEERLVFDLAAARGFLEVGGSGWRKERRDAPLLNTYRSFCDARAHPSVVVFKGRAGADEVVVDLSPARRPRQAPQLAAAAREACTACANGFGGTLPPPVLSGFGGGGGNISSASCNDSGTFADVVGHASAPNEDQAAMRAVPPPEALTVAAQAVRRLKEEAGLGNDAPEVVATVAELNRLRALADGAAEVYSNGSDGRGGGGRGGGGRGGGGKRGGGGVADSGGTANGGGDDDAAAECDAAAWLELPIYRLPMQTLAWEGVPRAGAKALARALAAHFGLAANRGGKSGVSAGVGGRGSRSSYDGGGDCESGCGFKVRSAPRVKPGKSRRHGGYGIG